MTDEIGFQTATFYNSKNEKICDVMGYNTKEKFTQEMYDILKAGNTCKIKNGKTLIKGTKYGN